MPAEYSSGCVWLFVAYGTGTVSLLIVLGFE